MVGYTLGTEKMSEMEMIMAEVSMEISEIVHSSDNDECRPNEIKNNEMSSLQHHQQKPEANE